MNAIYSLRWRRLGFFSRWKTEKNITGHGLDRSQDKMVIYYADGSAKEIAQWHRCESRVGPDWIAAEKKYAERDAKQPISTTV